MNYCSNLKCKKLVKKIYPCNKCAWNLCSNSCLTDHTLEIHSSNYFQDNSRKSNIKSPFIKAGEYIKEIQYESYYDFSNFTQVKAADGKNPKIIGTGGIGKVYLAKNNIDEKLFAIKQIKKKNLIKSGASMDIIHREISIHQRIRHENIVQLYSHYEDKKNVYLIMDYVDSGTLFNFINKSKGCDEKQAFHYFIQVASAVYYLHEHNLIHRDLKPENLLLDQQGNIKLCDFGWCVDMSKGSRITFCGTYEYMAPEIIQEMPYDKSIDVWSLGILLYELIHGYSPFRSQSEECEEEYEEIFKNIIKYNFKIEKDIDKDCADLITKLLNPNNKNRMKIAQIFYHPWILSFEKEFKHKSFSDNFPMQAKSTVGEKELENKELTINENKSNTKTMHLDNSDKTDNIDTIDNFGDINKKENALQVRELDSKRKFLEKIKIFEKKFDKDNSIDKEEVNIVYKKEDDIEEKLNEDTNTKSNSSTVRKNSHLSIDWLNKKDITTEINESRLFSTDFNFESENKNKFLRISCLTTEQEITEESQFDPNDQNQRDKLFDDVINKIEKKNSKKKKNHNTHANTVSNNFNLKSNKINIQMSRNKTFTLKDLENDLNNLRNISDDFSEKDEKVSILDQPCNISKNTTTEKNNNEACNIIFERLEDTNKIRYTTSNTTHHASNDINANLIKNRYNNSVDISAIIFKKKCDKILQHEMNKEIDISFISRDYSKNDSKDTSKKNQLDAIQCLENAEYEQANLKKGEDKGKGFWGKVSSFFNPFRCGKDV